MVAILSKASRNPPVVLAELFAVGFLVLGFAYGQRSILSLMVPLALVAFIAMIQDWKSRDLLRTLITPFAPLILTVAVVAFFQETLSQAFALLSLVVMYVLARLVRKAFHPSLVLFAIAGVGFVMGTIRQASLTPINEVVPLVRKLAEIHYRNPAGTAVAFGFVGLLLLTWYLGTRQLNRALLLLGLVSMTVLLLFSDVMTGLIGGVVVAAGLAILGSFPGLWPNFASGNLRPLYWRGILGVSGAVSLAVVAVNLRLFGSSAIPSLERDFGNLTGRRLIWECYFDAVAQDLPDPWMRTLECAGDHANLHSTFLQSHLIAGPIGLGFTILAFLLSIVLALRAVFMASSRKEFFEGFLSIGLVSLGMVFAFTESYLFVYLYPTILVFWAAPEWDPRIGIRQLTNSTAHVTRRLRKFLSKQDERASDRLN